MLTLEIGMALYADTGKQRLVVVRVTPKRAFCKTLGYVGEVEFEREQSSNGFLPRGSSNNWSTPVYYLETEENKAAYNRHELSSLLNRIRLQDLTTDQLQRILKIAKEEPK